jgi:hypothetical protein
MRYFLPLVTGDQAKPLVDPRIVYDYSPNRNRPDQDAVLASWRVAVRRHFGIIK